MKVNRIEGMRSTYGSFIYLILQIFVLSNVLEMIKGEIMHERLLIIV